MTALRVSLSRFRALFLGRRLDDRLDEELRCHLDFLTEENVRRGMDPKRARAEARKSFGSLDATKEEYRDLRGIRIVESTLRDVRYALRVMRRNPVLSATVIGVLALGIGANTALFSILYTLFLRPLPYPESDRLVVVGETPLNESRVASIGPVGYENYTEWRTQNQVFDGIAAFRAGDFNVKAGTQPERLRAESVSEEFFRVLSMPPVVGRALQPEDFRPSAGRVVVLSYAYWRAAFASSPQAIGARIHVEGQPATVVGVMPERFRSVTLEGRPGFWTPLVPDTDEAGRNNRSLSVVARLKPGLSLERARGDMAAIARRLERERPEYNRGRGVWVEGVYSRFVEAAQAPVARLLVAAVVILLLIACANVANLLLGRGLGRSKEIALRLAMGAGRFRLVRQLLVENLLFALAGAAAGVLVASAALATIAKVGAPVLADAGIIRFEIDGRVLLFCLGLATLTGLVFGILPAIRGSAVDVHSTLKEGGAGPAATVQKRRSMSLLVTAEIALSLMLLVAAGLVLVSVRQSWSYDWGFPIENRVTAGVSLSRSEYADPGRRAAFFGQLLEQLEREPGVRAATLTSTLPVSFGPPTTGVRTAQAEFRVSSLIVSAGYLRTLGIPLRAGRFFDERDAAGSDLVAVVNETTARKLGGDTNALGARIEVRGQWRTVIGVVPDVANRGLLGRPGYEVSVPYTQDPPAEAALVVYHAGNPSAPIAAISRLVHGIDGDQPVFRARTFQAAHAQTCGPLEFVLTLIGGFAVIALLLSAAGVYGVAANSVSTRTREIGIRMALGADRSLIVLEVLRRDLAWGLLGIAIGVAGAGALAKVVTTQVWWVKADRLQLITLATLLMGTVIFLAHYIPVRRATRVDPAGALRTE